MKAALLLSALALLLAACGDGTPPIRVTALDVRVETDAATVAPGEAFRLTVERIHDKRFEVVPWDDAALSPLVVRLEETRRREDARRVEETWVYRAYAFALEDVTVPPVVFAARRPGGGDLRVVQSAPISVAVRPALDADQPGESEGPGPMRAESTSAVPWLALLAVLVLAGGVWRLGRARRADSGEADATPRTSPAERARVRLDAAGHDVTEAAEALRAYVHDTWQAPTRERTTQEILDAAPILALPSPTARDALASVLDAADLAKFARLEYLPDEGRRLIERAQAFVSDVEGSAP